MVIVMILLTLLKIILLLLTIMIIVIMIIMIIGPRHLLVLPLHDRDAAEDQRQSELQDPEEVPR